MSSSWEDARRCPKSGDPGEVTKTEHQRGGGRVVTLTCRNERCKWYNTSWLVEFRADGSIPDPDTSRSRMRALPPMPPGYLDQLERDAQMLTTLGVEINR